MYVLTKSIRCVCETEKGASFVKHSRRRCACAQHVVCIPHCEACVECPRLAHWCVYDSNTPDTKPSCIDNHMSVDTTGQGWDAGKLHSICALPASELTRAPFVNPMMANLAEGGDWVGQEKRVSEGPGWSAALS